MNKFMELFNCKPEPANRLSGNPIERRKISSFTFPVYGRSFSLDTRRPYRGYVLISIVPSMYFIAEPEMKTRLFFSSQVNFPPLGEICFALSIVFPNFSDQYGVSCVYAEPVTGSSGIPYFGAKNLATKSRSSADDRAVTITPRRSSCSRKP